MENCQERTLPEGLAQRLERAPLKYTSPEAIYFCVWMWGASFCGVFGDGPNGAYEWFIWRAERGQHTLETSDQGYGSASIALRDVLLKVEPLDLKRACTRGAHPLQQVCPDAFGVPCSPPADLDQPHFFKSVRA